MPFGASGGGGAPVDPMAALVLERQEAAKALEEKELLFEQEGLDRWAAARCHSRVDQAARMQGRCVCRGLLYDAMSDHLFAIAGVRMASYCEVGSVDMLSAQQSPAILQASSGVGGV